MGWACAGSAAGAAPCVASGFMKCAGGALAGGGPGAAGTGSLGPGGALTTGALGGPRCWAGPFPAPSGGILTGGLSCASRAAGGGLCFAGAPGMA
eukprot:2449985-Alexandrium_andersonii.AAC.1